MDDLKIKKERIVYLSVKRKVLKADLDSLRSEEAEVRQAVRASTDKKSDHFKVLKSRLVFLRHRPQELVKQMQEAADEKKKLRAEMALKEPNTSVL